MALEKASEFGMTRSKLHDLKSELAKLRTAERGRQFAMIAAQVIVLFSILLAVWFGLDYLFRLNPTQRVLMVVLTLPWIVFAIGRSIAQLKKVPASLIDVALSVEKYHGIDGDFVAALQFESGHAIGSRQLQDAVIQYVSELNRDINVFEQFDGQTVWNRLGVIALIVACIAAIVGIFPTHSSTFTHRMLLADARYPTQTQIEVIRINGQPVAPDTPVTIGFGNELALELVWRGKNPTRSIVQVQNSKGSTSELDLTPNQSGAKSLSHVVPRITESAMLTFYAGDAYSETYQIETIPLPALQVDLEIVPPKYAQEIELASTHSTSNATVLAGSDVRMTISADREMQDMQFKLRRGPTLSEITLAKQSGAQHSWSLAENESLLFDLTETTTYELTGIDRHGLSPAAPMRGTIRVVPDRAPVASMRTIHHLVLPSAKPILRYRASDDFGLAQLRLQVRLRKFGKPYHTAEFPLASWTSASATKTIEDETSIDLSQWQLEIGDTVEVQLLANDFRGSNEEWTGTSEPLFLEVADEGAVLAAIAESDEQSERMLGELIRYQLEMGDHE